VVAIEYRVRPGNAVEFAAVINEVGRIRRRDGARAWSIAQDVDAVELWVERFECPTWLDYLRWRTRPTQSDQTVRERLVGLIEGEQFRVRRLVVRPPGAHPLGRLRTSSRRARAASAATMAVVSARGLRRGTPACDAAIEAAPLGIWQSLVG